MLAQFANKIKEEILVIPHYADVILALRKIQIYNVLAVAIANNTLILQNLFARTVL